MPKPPANAKNPSGESRKLPEGSAFNGTITVTTGSITASINDHGLQLHQDGCTVMVDWRSLRRLEFALAHARALHAELWRANRPEEEKQP